LNNCNQTNYVAANKKANFVETLEGLARLWVCRTTIRPATRDGNRAGASSEIFKSMFSC